MGNETETVWDVIVIGGGPAGMMAAARAGERGCKVLLLEKNHYLGVKLAITGGGRCNITNNKPNVRTMLAQYKDAGKFLFSTFTQHGVPETIAWFKERGVLFHEENDGRLFPTTNKATTIVDTLIATLQQQQVTIRTATAVSGITYHTATALFSIQLDNKKILQSRTCIVATGGTSRPDTGSTGEGFKWLQTLGHTIVHPSLALVPLTLQDQWVPKVSGITLSDIRISLFSASKKQRAVLGKILFTHTGVSGPTVLNMSSEVKTLLTKGTVTLTLDLFPHDDEKALRLKLQALLQVHSNQKLRNVLALILPRALVTVLLELVAIDGETPAHSIRTKERTTLVSFFKKVPLHVKGLLDESKAIVSSGGVTLTEVDFKTMQSQIVPNLFLVGDILNIDRPSGGYSLQLCWSTGYVAGDHC